MCYNNRKGVYVMAISFDKLRLFMESRGKSVYHLTKDRIIGKATLQNILTGQKAITTDTINAICNYLECDITDIMEYTPDQQNPD